MHAPSPSKAGTLGPPCLSDAAFEAQLTKGIDFYVPNEFAGGIPQVMAPLPQVRIGKRRFTTAQILTVLVPLGFVAGICVVAVAQQLRTIPAVQAFIPEYPSTSPFPPP